MRESEGFTGADLRGTARQRGFALLIVLWTVVVLSMIVAAVGTTGRSEIQLATNLLSAATTQTAADAAVQLAAFRLLDRSEFGWAADGIAHEVLMPNTIRVKLQVESEDGKVNPNLASPGLLSALLQEAGLTQSSASFVADNVIQWRVAWSRPAVENPAWEAYRAAGRTYGPPGSPFRNLDEIGAVLGMTPELLARVRPDLSLYAPREPNPAYTSRTVLAAIRGDTESGTSTNARRSPPNVVGITASALSPDGARFIRSAIIQLTREAGETPVRVLKWDRYDEE